MNIFYATPDQISDHEIEITGDEAHHLSRVLRHKVGDSITVVDGIGNKYTGFIDAIRKKNVHVRIKEKETLLDPDTDSPKLILGMGIIKNRQRLEFAVEKAIELGVREIVLFNSRYTEKSNIREDRLKSIMVSAMKQSMHAVLPVLKTADSLTDVLNMYKNCRFVIAHEKYDGKIGIPTYLKKAKEILALVGPEGGFSEDEVNLVRSKGGDVVSLGHYRLRAETAAITLLSQFIAISNG